MAFLDANATEPLRPEARAAAIAAMDLIGNPSSVHQAGRAARRLVEDARESLAATLRVRPAAIVFTSGGTEANAIVLAGAARRGQRILAGVTEHDSVRNAVEAIMTLAVDGDGVILLDALEAALALEPRPTLVAIMLANNETGAIQPVAQVAAICRRHGASLHVDAVQAPGRIALDLADLGADTFALSGHKVGGPKGAGALVLASPDAWPGAMVRGGGQERGMRGGTEPLPAIAGMAAAFAVARPDPDLAVLRDRIEAALSQAIAISAGAPRLPNTTCLALPGVAAATQVMALDLAGFAVSAGAACSSGKVSDSHVLRAMGLGALAGQAIRVSLPWSATADEVERFILAYRSMADRLAPRVDPRAA